MAVCFRLGIMFMETTEPGRNAGGIVFRLSLPLRPPQLSMSVAGPGAILTWPAALAFKFAISQ
jgi:hypothetical protein